MNELTWQVGVLLTVLGGLILYCYGYTFLGFLLHIFQGKKQYVVQLPKDAPDIPKGLDFKIWTQERGRGITIEWDANGLHHCHFHDAIYGWSNLSQTHTKEDCTDPAYCQWHGSL